MSTRSACRANCPSVAAPSGAPYQHRTATHSPTGSHRRFRVAWLSHHSAKRTLSLRRDRKATPAREFFSPRKQSTRSPRKFLDPAARYVRMKSPALQRSLLECRLVRRPWPTRGRSVYTRPLVRPSIFVDSSRRSYCLCLLRARPFPARFNRSKTLSKAACEGAPTQRPPGGRQIG